MTQPVTSEYLSILHVSDVHFGIGDDTAEQPRITDALVESVQEMGLIPHYCVFTGDLANGGSRSEFENGERWLARLIPPAWETKLLIVPGNHDVERKGTRANLFRAIAKEPKIYADWTRAKSVNCDHLTNFFSWHKDISNRLPVVGDWSTPFGFLFADNALNIPVIFIGLNSAMFSCDNNDEKNLVVDVRTLNTYLEQASQIGGIIIVIAHHPIDFLTDWNREQVERLLAQEKGAHVLMHGHLHDPSSRVKADNSGFGLTTLVAGAAYQDSKWPQGFALYTFDFTKREINTHSFMYSTSSGRWFEDKRKSRAIVANIPLYHGPLKSPVLDPNGSNAGGARRQLPPIREKDPTVNLHDARPNETEIGKNAIGRSVEEAKSIARLGSDIRGIAQDLREAARDAQRKILQYLSTSVFEEQEFYAIKSRVKKLSRIIEKAGSRDQPHGKYDVNLMPDICGFRIITKYQDQIPGVVESLLSQIENQIVTHIPFSPDRPIEVEINTSRIAADPLSLEQPVRAICSQSKLQPKVSMKIRDTAYSSIHFTGWVQTPSKEHLVKEIQVEIQIRSALEDVWGEIDHELDFRIRRSDKSIPRNRHLVVLKAMIDAIISYIDVIKRQASDAKTRPEIEKVRPRSVSDPRSQLRKMSAFNIPQVMYERLEKAYTIWDEAYQSGEEQGRPDLFAEGAKAFSDLLAEFRDEPKHSPEAAAEFKYICEIEYAYMLQYTEQAEALKLAEDVYINILERRENDNVANFRLGALYRKLEKYDESRIYLQKAHRNLLKSNDPEINTSHFIFDNLRREIGLTEWRIAEDQSRAPEVRREALLTALNSAYDIIKNPAIADAKTRLSAINDFLYYYCWEATQIADVSKTFIIPSHEIKVYAEELYSSYRKQRPTMKYNWVDTLLRCFKDSPEKALELANTLDEILERRLVTEGKPLPEVPPRGTIRWLGLLLPVLDKDERDSLMFAQEIKERFGNRKGSP